ncbi:GDSL-type esterase/lipase family protein [Actinophytocola sediminis]
MRARPLVLTMALLVLAPTVPAIMPAAAEAPARPSTVVVTNEQTPVSYTETGTWKASALTGFDGSGTRYSDTAGATATWHASVPRGRYEVAVWYPTNPASTEAAHYTVDGDEVVIDQRTGGGGWRVLGDWALAGDASVTLTSAGTGNHRADAVRFTSRATERDRTGTWMAAPSRLDATVAGQTVRMIAHTSVGGRDARVRLSNVHGTAPVTFRSAYLGLQRDGAEIRPGTNRRLTFGGRPAVTIPVGGTAESDPVRGHLPAATNVVVSVYTSQTHEQLNGHLRATQESFVSTPGDHAREHGGRAYDTTITSWYWLDRISVVVPDGPGSVVMVGDSMTDGGGTSVNANRRWPDHLSRRLQELPADQRLGVLNAGMSGNRILLDDYGPRTLSRLDGDALAQPGVRTVFLLQGITDISRSVTEAAPLIAAYREIIDRAHARGVRIVGATLIPCGGASACAGGKEQIRQQVNEFIRTSGEFDAVVDFDAALRDPADPGRMLTAYDSGDHLHQSDAGRERMAQVVDLSLL